MTPVHNVQHNEGHEFLGHFLGHDVWLVNHGDSLGPSIVARYGNEGCEYASQAAVIFMAPLETNHKIGSGSTASEYWCVPYHEYLASDKVAPSTAAMIQGLALRMLRQLTSTKEAHARP